MSRSDAQVFAVVTNYDVRSLLAVACFKGEKLSFFEEGSLSIFRTRRFRPNFKKNSAASHSEV